MIAENAIPTELVEVLSEKTKANQIQWSFQDSKYALDLPECKLILSVADKSVAMPPIVVEVDSPQGTMLGIIHVTSQDSRYDQVRQLLVNAQANARSRLDEILRRAALSVKEIGCWAPTSATTSTFSTTSKTQTTPPPMPPPPSEEQARSLFAKIAGEWFLDFSRGAEILRIDDVGRYYTYSPKHWYEPDVQAMRKYQLTLEHCDAELEQVEVAKRELDGRVRQLEVLTIAPMIMTGYAKHDAHPLRYAWNGWYQCYAKSSKQMHLRAKNGEDAKHVYIRAMGIVAPSPEITVLRCSNYKPSAADLDLDRRLYPDSPFTKET